MSQEPEGGAESKERLAERLRERVYVSFTALAVLLALSAHTEGLDAAAAALTLVVTVAGVLLAGFAADLIAYTVTHSSLPNRDELAQMARVVLGGLTSVALPLALIGAAYVHWLSLITAITGGQIVLMITLGSLGLIALRRVRLPMSKRLLLIALLVAIGAFAVLLELLAHTL